ncbi:MBL fold metallo-hydrolase [soil metagenome]
MTHDSAPRSPGLARRAALRAFALTAGAAALPGAFGFLHSAHAEESPSPTASPAGSPPPKLTLTNLGGMLTHIAGSGGNILVLGGPDNAVVIDSGLPDLAGRTATEARKGGPIALLINTHWHYDHVGANEILAKSGVRLMAHANTRQRMAVEHNLEPLGLTVPAAAAGALPRITFTHETRLSMNDEEIRLVPAPPAHTDGDVIVHFEKADVIHAGDTFFHRSYPFIDYSSGGWIGGMVAAAKMVATMTGPGTRIMPGHGPLATADEFKQYVDFLETMLERFTKLKEQGRSVDEVVAAQPAKEFDEKFGKGFMKPEPFVRIAYEGLLRHK